MGVALNMRQNDSFAERLAEQQAAAIMPKVRLVADSPNLTRSVEEIYGKVFGQISARPFKSASSMVKCMTPPWSPIPAFRGQ